MTTKGASGPIFWAGSAASLPPCCVETIEALQGPPGWRIHQLTGDRAGTWSISVSGNWRVTFEIASDEINNLDLEDYH